MVKDRSIIKEWERRNELRTEHHKKRLTLMQDMTCSTRKENINGKRQCFAPWKELDLYPDGEISYCSWVGKRVNIYDYLCDGEVDWEALYNSMIFYNARFDVEKMLYTDCMRSCPLNERYNAGHYPLEVAISEENYHYLDD